MRLCYVLSEYPKVSHTFIRREIQELERQGATVLRAAARGHQRTVDEVDEVERAQTFYLLQRPPWAFAAAVLRTMVGRPRDFLRAASSAFKMMRRSHRPKLYHLIYLVEACVLAEVVVQRRIEHMHAHFGTNPAEVAMLVHLLTGIPYSFTVHGPEEFDKPEYLALREKVQHAAFVCAISSFGRSQLFRWIRPVDWPKIHVVRCGLDAAFSAKPEDDRFVPDRLVCVGRICEQKGQLLLLEALARLRAEGIHCQVVFGGDGEMRSDLERRSRELGVEDLITVTGWIGEEEVKRYIRSARALVLPSFAEGIPLVLMESLACERPVVTTYVAGIPELVLAPTCGWLVPAGSVEPLADALKACLSASRDDILTMGRAGREIVLEMHDISQECSKLVTLFRAGHGSPAETLVPPGPQPN